MRVQINSSDLVQYLPIFFGVLIGVCIVMLLIVLFLKNKDNSKPMQTMRAKIIEKPIQQGNIEWYVIECEDGRRLKLRNFQSNQLIIAVGDVGIISFKGKTIQSFRREKKS